jgi:hypothetical protein
MNVQLLTVISRILVGPKVPNFTKGVGEICNSPKLAAVIDTETTATKHCNIISC